MFTGKICAKIIRKRRDDGSELVSDIGKIFKSYGIPTQIIAASIRGPQDVVRAALAGSDIATVPYKVIMQMTKHPLTDAGIEKFLKDWNKMD